MKFRQKLYAAPLLAAAARALPHVANAVNVGQGAMAIKQGFDASKMQEQQMDMQEQQMEQQRQQHAMQMKLQKQQMESQQKRDEAMQKSLDSIVNKSPENAASAAASIMSHQRKFSDAGNGKILTLGNLKGFGKDVGTFLGNNRDAIYNIAGGALVATAVGYGVNKLLQKDHDLIRERALEEERKRRMYKQKPRRSPNIEDAELNRPSGRSSGKYQKSYSASNVTSAVSNVAKDVGSGIGKAVLGRLHPMSLATTAVLGSGMLIANHLLTREAVKDMAKQSAMRKVDREVRAMKGVNRSNRNYKIKPDMDDELERPNHSTPIRTSQKSYSLVQKGLGGVLKDGLRYVGNYAKDSVKARVESVKGGFREFKANPGEYTLGKISTHVGGYSAKDNREGTAEFKSIGYKSGNPISKKVGDFLVNNPKTALLATIPIGIGVAKLATIPASWLQKGISKADKRAWSYGQYQEGEFDD